MTVAELIEALQALPKDLVVIHPDEIDYARVYSAGLVRIAARRVDFVRADSAPVTAVALNYDPADLARSAAEASSERRG